METPVRGTRAMACPSPVLYTAAATSSGDDFETRLRFALPVFRPFSSEILYVPGRTVIVVEFYIHMFHRFNSLTPLPGEHVSLEPIEHP